MNTFQQERIQKVLAQLGVASRRTVESWITAGKITVNGKPATLGQPIGPHDRVQVQGKPVSLEHYGELPTRVLKYYKPEGEVCSHQAMDECPSVFAALPRIREGKWVMIGRLDVNSMGLLLFTNNGQLAHSMMHPRFQLPRKYVVRIIGRITQEHIENMKLGVVFEEGMFKFDEIVQHPSRTGVNSWFTVTLHQGHYREVRRLFESQGATVNRLSRVQFGEVTLPRFLRRGKWEELSEMEVKRLMKRYVGEDATGELPPEPTLGDETERKTPRRSVHGMKAPKRWEHSHIARESSSEKRTLKNPVAGKRGGKNGDPTKRDRIPISFREKTERISNNRRRRPREE